ncbi:hypothetical protein DVH24_034294 [Malus domestica]|uniref:UNC-50 family protein n=1 Tax=Malus domestica TaxID=3750 RepID=A0A498IZ60_MALDO|nr:hypothetical protein DVH24_034294 [Malus domestica]
MLPTTSRGRSSSSSSRTNPMPIQYLRRIIKVLSSSLIVWWQQMDIEYTFWQMLHLCTSPKVVYQHTKYHKQTKNQWARDDPAFVVICSVLLAVATLAYCAAYDHSAAHAVFVVISVLFFHFLFIGMLLATFCWFLTNSYLREEAPNSHVVEQHVEWLYAFDVHCNSFFPIDPLFSITNFGSSWLPSCIAIKFDIHGGHFILSLSQLFSLPLCVILIACPMFCSAALSGEDHFLPVSNQCCHCPLSDLDFEWLQSFKILYEHSTCFEDSVPVVPKDILESIE